MWERLGHKPSVALAPWPTVDPALLVEDEVECVLQINGKIKQRIQVPPGISQDELQALALNESAIVNALAGATPKTIIVRAPKIVNIVVA
jgi:leucyl-tRNA synthetase